ncbi:MAG: hypothetical protein ACYC5Q_10140 [Thermoleophilia bacterium]
MKEWLEMGAVAITRERRTSGVKGKIHTGRTDVEATALREGHLEMNAMETRPSARPLYPVPEASRYARAKSSNVRRWLSGYDVSRRHYPPLLEPPAQRPQGDLALSFENLIEIALVTALRGSGISLQTVREAHQIAMREFGEHPFARRDVFVSGTDIFMKASELVEGEVEHLTALTRGGQRAFEPVLRTYLSRIDWDNDWPVQWRPRDGGVVLQNPEIVFGLPNVRGVRTEVIRARFEAGH